MLHSSDLRLKQESQNWDWRIYDLNADAVATLGQVTYTARLPSASADRDRFPTPIWR